MHDTSRLACVPLWACSNCGNDRPTVPTAPTRSMVRRSNKPLKGTDTGDIIASFLTSFRESDTGDINTSFLFSFHEPDVAIADRAAMRLQKQGASLGSWAAAVAFLRQR